LEQIDWTEGVELPMPGDGVAVYVGVYVHGVGFSLRILAVPGATDEAYFATLRAAESEGHQVSGMHGVCEHQKPAVWCMYAVYPGESEVYTVHTIDTHLGAKLVTMPTLIKAMALIDYNGETAPLVPLNPVTLDAALSIGEATAHLSEMGGHVTGGSTTILGESEYRQLGGGIDDLLAGLEAYLAEEMEGES
jgi:hypothetical protein